MNNGIKLTLAFVLSVAVGFGAMYGARHLVSGFSARFSKVSAGDYSGRFSEGSGGIGGSINDITSNREGNVPSPLPKTDSLNEHGIFSSSDIRPVLDVSKIKVRLAVGDTSYHYTVSGVIVSASDGETDYVDGDLQYLLADKYNHRYESNDGQFNAVEPNSDGIYSLKVLDKKHRMAQDEVEIKGFTVRNPVTKLTASELSRLFNTGDYSGSKSAMNGKFAPNVAVISSTDGFSPMSYMEVFTLVDLEGWSVTVTSLRYDCLNQITRIYLRANK